MQIKPPNPEEFIKAVTDRQRGQEDQTLEQVATRLSEHYRNLDAPARQEYVNTTVRMYANYENRWLGSVSADGKWVSDNMQGSNNVYFTVPLLTAHVDTHTVFYTKVRPKYIAKPFINNHLNRQLAKMCQQIGTDELARLVKNSQLQHEAQYIALATLSYRQLTMDPQPHSPVIQQQYDEKQTNNYAQTQCQECSTKMEAPESEGLSATCANEDCMSDNLSPTTIMPKEETVTKTKDVVLPRPKLTIPNPTLVQRDFNALDYHDARFIIMRRKIPKKEAEFYYQLDLSSAPNQGSPEAESQARGQRSSVGAQPGAPPFAAAFDFGQYLASQNETVEEVQMWLAPCEYGLFFADGTLLQEQYPYGLYIMLVGDRLVKHRPCDKNLEWIRVQQGVRPMSDSGMGMVHLAELNDVVNNTLSLDYSILRTHGFPVRLWRGKWIDKLPGALTNIFLDKVSDDQDLSKAVHTEQPSNASMNLGVMTSRVQGLMQYVGGSLNPTGMPGDMKDIMGTATGAASVQEMMSDRMGLSVQMRVEADIDTTYAILTFLQRDPRNRQVFIEGGYDEMTVDAFFEADFRSRFYFEPVKGTDEPKMDSVNTYKVQAFAQLTAALTGLRQFDPDTFYDIVDALGDTLNLDASIGAGRKERNLAENQITRVTELYRETKDLQENMNIDPLQFGEKLFQAITLKQKDWLEAVIQANQPKPIVPPKNVPMDEQTQLLLSQKNQLVMQEASHVAVKLEAYLYDYTALAGSYSDWLESDSGQDADTPMQVAIGLLWAYARSQEESRKSIERQEAMAMIGAEAAPAAGNDTEQSGANTSNDAGSNGRPAKRDGTFGPGRPAEPHVTAPSGNGNGN